MIQTFVKVLVVRPDRRVLVLKRSITDERRPGEWDFPGGGVEPGESPNEGAVRELYEETGIQILTADLKLLYAATSFYEPGQDSNTRMLFVVKVDDSQVANITLSHEHEDSKWQSMNDAAEEHPHPVYRAGLQYALDNNLI